MDEVKVFRPVSKPSPLNVEELNSYDEVHSFGMDPKKAAEFLRTIADRLDSKEYLVQSCSLLGCAEKDDYAMNYLTMQFYRKKVAQ